MRARRHCRAGSARLLASFVLRPLAMPSFNERALLHARDEYQMTVVRAAGVAWVTRTHPPAGPGRAAVASPVDRESRCEATRKARQRLSLIVLANRLSGSYALTFGHDLPASWDETVQLGSRAVYRLGRRLGYRPKYLFVAEQSQRGRWHIHLQVSCDVRPTDVRAAWGDRGRVVPFNVIGFTGLRNWATYLSKDFDTVPQGRHRYRCARGLVPEPEYLLGSSSVELVDLAATFYGRPDECRRHGIDYSPVTVMQWDRPLGARMVS